MIDRRRYKKNGLAFKVLLNVIANEFKDVEEFINEISENLDSKIEEINYWHQKEIDSPDEENDEDFDYHMMLAEDAHKYGNVFTKYHYNSMLLSVFSILEYWLRRFCDTDAKRNFSKVKLKDLKGNMGAIEPSRNYLKLVAEIDVSESDDLWKKITDIQKVRNAITHHNSNIKTNKNIAIEKQELYYTVLNDKRINFQKDRGSFFIQDKEYLFEAIKLFKAYLGFVASKLMNRSVIAKNTTMPYNNDIWGVEKSYLVVAELVDNLCRIDKSDIDDKDDLKSNLYNALVNATKIYAFFCNSEWDPSDVDLIIEKGEEGLEDIKGIYQK